MSQTAHQYQARVLEVHDGDTVKLSVDLAHTERIKDRDFGFHVYIEQGRLVVHESFRLLGLNAPELVTPAGKTAQEYLDHLLRANAAGGAWVPLTLRTKVVRAQDQQEKFGRYLATLWLSTEDPDKAASVNLRLIQAGQAAPWDGAGPKPVP